MQSFHHLRRHPVLQAGRSRIPRWLAAVLTAVLGTVLTAPLGAQARFVRGDIDGADGASLADAIALGEHLFRAAPRPACADAADVNDDGRLDLTDVTSLLLYLYRGAGPPSPPHPGCGADPTPDALPCEGAPRCQVIGEVVAGAEAIAGAQLAAWQETSPASSVTPDPGTPELASSIGSRESRALPSRRSAAGRGGSIIAAGEIVQGEISSRTQVDAYDLEFAPGSTIVLDRIAASNAAALGWRLEDSWGRMVVENRASLDDLGPVAVLGGAYTLTIFPEASLLGTYTFRWVDATPVEMHVAIGEVIPPDAIDVDHPGQRHQFHFSAAPNQTIFLDNLASGISALSWQLVDSHERVLVSSRRIADQGPISLVGGEYLLTVEGTLASGNLATGGYELRIVGIPASTPQPLALGAIATGEIAVPGEIDTWTFTAAPGQRIFLDQISTTNAGVLDWELTDHLGRAVLARTGSLSDVGPIALAGGDYTLRILPEGGNVGSYSFRLSDAGSSLESIAIGAEVVGVIPAERPGTVNSYAFTSPPARLVTVELINTSNVGGLDWLMQDAQGRKVLATSSLNTIGPIALLGGAYRLDVLGEGAATGTYRFRLRDDGAAGAAVVGAPRSAGDVVDEAIAVPGGEMRYTFDAAAGLNVYLDLLLGHDDIDWSLVDAVGTVLGSARANSVDSSDLGPFPLAAGSYTVVLRARTATAAPPYRFQIAVATRQTSDVAPGDTIEGGFTGAPGSVHAYRFDVAEGAQIFLDRLIASARLSWTLLDPAGQPVFALVRADGVDNDMGPFTLAAGTYTLVLDPDAGYQPAYRIGIRAAVSEEDTVSPGAIVSGSFAGLAGSRRTIRIDVADGERILIDRRAATARLDAALYDPAGEPVFGPVRFDSGDGDQGPFTLTGGTYRLVIDPQNGYEPTYDLQIVDVDDTALPLVFGQAQGGIIGPGGTASYGFHAAAGARFFVDLGTGATSLRWSLLDDLEEAVFSDLAASSATADIAPLNLAAGDYRLVLHATASSTPTYAFTAWTLSVDLGVEGFSGSPLAIFAGDATREVEVTWSVLNRGGGPAPTGAWTDRLTYSADAVLGNADDVVLGDFVRFDTLAPWDSYERRERVRIPTAAPLGQHRIFLSVDAAGAYAEPGGETDNVASVEVAVVADLPAAEPDFVSTSTFPFTRTGATPGATVDVPLSRAVSLDSIRYVHAEALELELRAPPGASAETIVTLALLSGQEEMLEVSSVDVDTASTPTSFVVRFSRRLTPQVVALLPNRSVDGVRFRFDQPATTQTTIQPIHADLRLRVHLAGCEFAPCGPHLERRSPGLAGATQQGNGVSPWRAVTFDEGVPGDGLRFVSGPNFTGGAASFLGVVSALTEAQLILDDGTLVTLDDVRAPSTLGLPPFQSLSASHSLGLASSQLAGRQILGFQWRIHVNGAGVGTPSAGFSPVNDAAIRFLYEVESCHGAIAVPPVEVSPADGSAFEPGSMVTLAGRSLAPQAGRPVSAVLVNGEPVDSLDAAGRFFKTVRISAGENPFVIQVVEPGCGESESLLWLVGATGGSSGLDGYVDATSLLRVEYADTTFQRARDALVIRARARNVSSHAVRGPILLALTGLSPASATLRGAAGVTQQGEPYTVLLESGALEPGAAGSYVYLVFDDPDRERLHYGLRWLVPADRPPHFESSPPVLAVAGRAYRYLAAASDPDGDPVELELERGPPGMTLDPAGAVSWTPATGDLGAHDVVLAAVAAGARATQRWALVVSDSAPSRPPYFTTSPVTVAPVGGSYLYDADAVDPDGDPLGYSLLEAPAGMVVGPSDGRIAWALAAPGEHRVSLGVADGAGGEAVQTFPVAAGSLPSNPSAPRITTAPATEGRIGVLYIYQPVASDPDGDVLQFSLPGAPAGMTIDARGRLAWTPAAEQVGTHAVRLLVGDGRGGETSQSFEVAVQGGVANLAPIIESVPTGFTLAGDLYRYQVEALDPDGDPLRFVLASHPAGMSIDESSGLVEWAPGAGNAGNHLVAVEAIDTQGAAGRQVYELVVRTANAAPRLGSGPPSVQITAGRVYQVDIDAGDADGDLVRYELDLGPAAITVHPITGLTTWSTTPADVGEHDIVVRAVDAFGGQAEAAFTVTVVPDVEPPRVIVAFSAAPAPVGVEVVVSVGASDDVSIVSRTLTVECPPDAPRELELDVLGRTTFASPRTGYCTFRATATDPSGNVGTAEETLQVGNPEDPLDPHPPVVEILSPAPGSTITSPVDVVATITDATAPGLPGNGPFTWTVEIAPRGNIASGVLSPAGNGGGAGQDPGASGGFQVIGSGSGLPRLQSLGVFDPTLLPNGVYRLRISGMDGVQVGGVEYDVSVAGKLKIGNFTTTVTDLVLPLAGIPIVIARRYDSLDVSPGEFGAGWRLDLPGRVEDSAQELDTGNGLVDLLGRETFSFGTRVYVTRPDGQRVGFTFQPRSRGGALAFLWVPYFEPDPGVTDTLEALPAGADVFMVGGRANQVGVPYNPSLYRLTVKEGVSYILDEKAGLQRIEDREGNSIDARPDGLFSSLGPAIRFERDAAGRIARVIEDREVGPPEELLYQYDGQGNLIASVDALGSSTRYFYEDAEVPHHLTRIVDPLGRPWLRNAFDAEGRLVGLCGAGGDPATLDGCSAFAWDAGARVSTAIDSRGSRYDLVFDEQGNTIIARQYLDDGSSNDFLMDYDARANLIRLEYPSGEVWTSTYDERGNETSRTDPLGRTWRWTYDACDELISESDPAGSTTQLTVDDRCLPLEWAAALGNTYRFTFNGAGSVSAMEDPEGNRWTFGYDTDGGDGAGRAEGEGGGQGQPVLGDFGYLTRGIDPRGKLTTVATNESGKVTSRLHADGRSLAFQYDADQRLLRETWNTDPPRTTHYEYDAAGQLIRAFDPDSDIRIEYFATGWVRSMETAVLPAGPSVLIEYEYDGNGNVTAVRDSFGGLTTYEYDGAGRLACIRQSGSAVNDKRVDALYSSTSVLTELRRFSDLSGSSPVANTSLTYECESCLLGLTGITHRRAADGSLLEHIELERNPDGVLLNMVDAEGEHSYIHDGQWRLLEASHPAGGTQPQEFYAYDGAGNRTSSHLGGAHVYGYSSGAGGNDIRGNDRFEYETDDLGNVARKRNRATGASTEYRYDHRFRLTDVIELSPGGIELRRSTYTYDSSDRRIRAVEDGQVSHFVHDGLNPILVLDGAGNIVIRRLYGRGLDSVLAFDAAGNTRWLLSDHLGSVRDVLGDDGRRLGRHVYDSFGNLAGNADLTDSGGLGFTGMEHSLSTGLIPIRARVYDPELGRFLQMDPLEPHQYDYAENSPMTYGDATGRRIRPLARAGIRLAADGPELFMDRLRKGFYSEKEVLKRLNPPTKYSGYGPKRFPPRAARASPPRGGPGEAGMYALLVTGIGLGIIGAVEQVGTALLLAYDSVLVYQEVYERISGGQ